MKTFEKSTTVEPLREKKQSNKAIIEDKDVFRMMEENLSQFKAIELKPNSYLPKLAFISSILRTYNLQKVTVEQNFYSAQSGGLNCNFVFTVLAEPLYSDKKSEREVILERFEELKNSTEDESNFTTLGNLAKEDEIEYQPIREQRANIKELFYKILKQLGDDKDAAIALTSFFVFELESMEQYRSQNFIAFYDMYNTTNFHDRWFAAIDIYFKELLTNNWLQ